jgi:hypothetical protein
VRGDIIVQSQLMIAQAIGALAKSVEESTGVALMPVSFIDLPGGRTGLIACVDDSTVNTPGDIIAGGGTYTALVWYDGINWKVLAA